DYIFVPLSWTFPGATMASLLRHLHSCSGCFRLERSPGGTCTHWKTPPFHGAHPSATFDCVVSRDGGSHCACWALSGGFKGGGGFRRRSGLATVLPARPRPQQDDL